MVTRPGSNGRIERCRDGRDKISGHIDVQHLYQVKELLGEPVGYHKQE